MNVVGSYDRSMDYEYCLIAAREALTACRLGFFLRDRPLFCFRRVIFAIYVLPVTFMCICWQFGPSHHGDCDRECCCSHRSFPLRAMRLVDYCRVQSLLGRAMPAGATPKNYPPLSGFPWFSTRLRYKSECRYSDYCCCWSHRGSESSRAFSTTAHNTTYM